jgi:hypothetical protein
MQTLRLWSHLPRRAYQHQPRRERFLGFVQQVKSGKVTLRVFDIHPVSIWGASDDLKVLGPVKFKFGIMPMERQQNSATAPTQYIEASLALSGFICSTHYPLDFPHRSSIAAHTQTQPVSNRLQAPMA